jgi:hypothetical protein
MNNDKNHIKLSLLTISHIKKRTPNIRGPISQLNEVGKLNFHKK